MEATFTQVDRSPPSRPGDIRAADRRLVERIVAGDQAAEEQLYRRYAALLLRLSTRLLGSRHEADDLVQDTFIKAFAEMASLRDPTCVRGWLVQIAVRLAYRRLRRGRLLRWAGLGPRAADVSAPDRDGVGLECPASPADSPEVRVEIALLDRALTRGPPEDRAAWILHRVEGFDLAEVAQAADCSLSTAQRRIAAMDVLVRRHIELGQRDGGGS